MLKKINFDCKKNLENFFLWTWLSNIIRYAKYSKFFKKNKSQKLFKIPKPRLEFTIHKMIGIQFTWELKVWLPFLN